jgi:hypothetical protein
VVVQKKTCKNYLVAKFKQLLVMSVVDELNENKCFKLIFN